MSDMNILRTVGRSVDALGGVAKAVAGLIVPVIAALVAWSVEQIGVDIPFDPSAVETAITGVLTAAAVWYVRNRPVSDG